MNMSRIINCGRVLFNIFHRPLPVYSLIGHKKMDLSQSSFFSIFCTSHRSLKSNKLCITSPCGASIVNARGMKVRAQLQLRCKDCYFVRKEGVMYVMCSSYPRHKQRAMTKRTKYTWILTHAFQTKYRPY